MTVGILALQGAFIEHQQMLKTLYVNSFLIRTFDDLNQADGWYNLTWWRINSDI